MCFDWWRIGQGCHRKDEGRGRRRKAFGNWNDCPPNLRPLARGKGSEGNGITWPFTPLPRRNGHTGGEKLCIHGDEGEGEEDEETGTER